MAIIAVDASQFMMTRFPLAYLLTALTAFSATVEINLRDFASANLNSLVTITNTSNPVFGGTNVFALPAQKYQPRNGQVTATLHAGSYKALIPPYAISFNVPDDTNTYKLGQLTTNGYTLATISGPWLSTNNLRAGTNVTIRYVSGTNYIDATGSGGGSGNATNFPYIDITNNTPGWREGRLAYDTNTHTFVAYNDRSNVTYNVGEELFVRCLNSSGSTISNGQLVTFSSTGGGTVPRITLAQASLVSAASDFPCLGMATENISNGESGMIGRAHV